MHHMPLEPEVPAQESTRVVQCSMSQCRRMCLQIKLIKFSGPDGHERQAKNPGEVEPQTGFTVQCSAKSCHVMTSTSEKPTNEKVDEIAVARCGRDQIVTTSRSRR